MGKLMSFGMMWLITAEDKEKSLLDNISEARDYYIEHYGSKPDLALVNPDVIPPSWKEEFSRPKRVIQLDENTYQVGCYEIRPCNTLEYNSLWLGFKPITY